MSQTPEEFLEGLNAIEDMIAALAPVAEMIGRIKKLYVEHGIGADAADSLALEFARAYILPAIMTPVKKRR